MHRMSLQLERDFGLGDAIRSYMMRLPWFVNIPDIVNYEYPTLYTGMATDHFHEFCIEIHDDLDQDGEPISDLKHFTVLYHGLTDVGELWYSDPRYKNPYKGHNNRELFAESFSDFGGFEKFITSFIKDYQLEKIPRYKKVAI